MNALFAIYIRVLISSSGSGDLFTHIFKMVSTIGSLWAVSWTGPTSCLLFTSNFDFDIFMLNPFLEHSLMTRSRRNWGSSILPQNSFITCLSDVVNNFATNLNSALSFDGSIKYHLRKHIEQRRRKDTVLANFLELTLRTMLLACPIHFENRIVCRPFHFYTSI